MTTLWTSVYKQLVGYFQWSILNALGYNLGTTGLCLCAVNVVYRAAEWDLSNPNWRGRMRVVAKGDQCIVKLEDKISGEYIKCQKMPR